MPHILMVGNYPPLYAPVSAALLAQGHQVTHLKAFEQFDPYALADVDLLYAPGSLPVGRAHLDRANRLKAAVSPITGTEGFDRDAFNGSGVLIAFGHPPENYISMAEATIMLVLAALYDLPGSQACVSNWGEDTQLPLCRRTLYRRTLGLVGLGQVAGTIAERLSGWGCELIAYAPRPPEKVPAGVEITALDDLLARSDVVCLLARLDSDSRHLLDERRLRLMKPDAVLVNTARGALVDEAALERVVREGHLAALALDVFEQEPLPGDSSLRNLPRAILTPHNVGHTVDLMDGLVRTAIANIERALACQPPLHIRNREALPAWLNKWGAPTEA